MVTNNREESTFMEQPYLLPLGPAFPRRTRPHCRQNPADATRGPGLTRKQAPSLIIFGKIVKVENQRLHSLGKLG
jgi:hypothetical protein